jgi:hypothetical protein
MYYVDVYEEDRMTVAGTREFSNKEACKHFATLNQPCVVFKTIYNGTDFAYFHEIARYGMEDEE